MWCWEVDGSRAMVQCLLMEQQLKGMGRYYTEVVSRQLMEQFQQAVQAQVSKGVFAGIGIRDGGKGERVTDQCSFRLLDEQIRNVGFGKWSQFIIIIFIYLA